MSSRNTYKEGMLGGKPGKRGGTRGWKPSYTVIPLNACPGHLGGGERKKEEEGRIPHRNNEKDLEGGKEGWGNWVKKQVRGLWKSKAGPE